MVLHVAYGRELHELHVVIVDPSRGMHDILRTMLRAFHVPKIRAFSQGEDALAAMQKEPPDLLICEHYLKGMTGCQLVRRMRHVENEPLGFVPVLMLTGQFTYGLLIEAVRSGVQQFLLKPVAPKEFYRRLEWILADGRHLIRRDRHYILEGAENRARKLEQASRQPLRNRQGVVLRPPEIDGPGEKSEKRERSYLDI